MKLVPIVAAVSMAASRAANAIRNGFVRDFRNTSLPDCDHGNRLVGTLHKHKLHLCIFGLALLLPGGFVVIPLLYAGHWCMQHLHFGPHIHRGDDGEGPERAKPL